MRRIVAVAVAVAAVAVLTLAACGEDDDDTAGGDTTTATTVQAVTSTSRPPASSTSTPVESQCGMVGFTPNSEDAASDIRATGVTCDEAKEFVRAAGARTSSGGPPTVNVEGYRCVLTRSVEDPLPQAFYECTNGALKISFTRS